jgi:hypothetical protein
VRDSETVTSPSTPSGNWIVVTPSSPSSTSQAWPATSLPSYAEKQEPVSGLPSPSVLETASEAGSTDSLSRLPPLSKVTTARPASPESTEIGSPTGLPSIRTCAENELLGCASTTAKKPPSASGLIVNWPTSVTRSTWFSTGTP